MLNSNAFRVVYERFNLILNESQDVAYKEFLKTLRSGFTDSGLTDVFNKREQLRIKSGSLYSSFKAGDRNNAGLTRAQRTASSVRLQVGSNIIYSRVHESGVPTRIYPKRFKQSGISMMEAFFWYKYMQTKHNDYKVLALTVRDKGYVTTKARLYFTKAVEIYNSKINNILNTLIEMRLKGLFDGLS